MDKMRPIFLLFLTTSFNAESIVIRHDTPDEQYINRSKVIDAHVTFTTPSKGSDYVVGSGTYLGKGWVLTAAHVANFFEDKDVAQLKSEKLKITEVLLHEKWKDRQFGFDIALVKIDMPKGDIAPVTLFSYELKKGDVITIAGKGDTGNGLVGIKQQDFKMRVAENKVDKIEGQWLSFNFSSPDHDALEYEGICGGGDSGSPAYIIENGTTHIIGLSSWQDTEATNWEQGYYGVIDYYTYLNHYREWIESHLNNS